MVEYTLSSTLQKKMNLNAKTVLLTLRGRSFFMGIMSEIALLQQEQEYIPPDITISHGSTTAATRRNQKKRYNNTEIADFIDFISATDNFSGSCWQIYAMHYYKDKNGKQCKFPKLICFGSKRLGTAYLNSVYFNQPTTE